MKKIIKNVLLGLLALLIIVSLGLSAFIGRQVFNGYTNFVSREETVNNGKTYGKEISKIIDKYQVTSLEIEDFNDKYSIPALLVQKPGNKNIALMIHGMGGTKETLAPLMGGFLESGYDVIAYDQRNSGDNYNNYNTFGVLESLDTLDVLRFIGPKYKNDEKNGKIILWGESYGALTSVIAAGRDDSMIDYLIVDSPISDARILLADVMRETSKKEGIPLSYLMSTGDWYSRFAIGVNFKDFDGRKWIKNVNKPIFISNSKDDSLTPPNMAMDLYDSSTTKDKVHHIVQGYKHGEFPYKENDVYMQAINSFIKNHQESDGGRHESTQWF